MLSISQSDQSVNRNKNNYVLHICKKNLYHLLLMYLFFFHSMPLSGTSQVVFNPQTDLFIYKHTILWLYTCYIILGLYSYGNHGSTSLGIIIKQYLREPVCFSFLCLCTTDSSLWRSWRDWMSTLLTLLA